MSLRAAALLLLLATHLARAAEHPVRLLRDLPYKDETAEALTDYEKERCKLNLAVPTDVRDFPTLVWFHGGGLKNGDKDVDSEHVVELAESLAKGGVAVATPNYRLSPKVRYPAYVDDAAAAFAWAVKHAAEHGGDPRKVFIGGHSAGGYLALLVAFDPKRLGPYGVSLGSVAGVAQVSGQVFTHYTVREERGLSKYAVIADEAAPSSYIRKALPPVLTIYAQNDMISRAEENQFFVATLKAAGHAETYSLRVDDRDHATVGHNIRNLDDPARLAILRFIEKQAALR